MLGCGLGTINNFIRGFKNASAANLTRLQHLLAITYSKFKTSNEKNGLDMIYIYTQMLNRAEQRTKM